MFVGKKCPRCEKDFMCHVDDVHLERELPENDEIRKDYPVQDDTRPSRRWNMTKTDYCDLSGGTIVICQDCHEKEIEENKSPEQRFCEHIEAWDEVGAPWGTSDLVKLAKKYGTEIPTLEDGELKWKDELIPNQKLKS